MEELIKLIEQEGLVVIMRGVDPERSVKVAEALVKEAEEIQAAAQKAEAEILAVVESKI